MPLYTSIVPTKNLTVLPLELPELPDSRTTYKLEFSNNKLLRRLENRDYFVNTSILDLSDCSVDEVSDWGKIVRMPMIGLSGNKISSLPLTFLSINITTRKLNLANNPWDCSCDNKWMSDCFSSITNRLTQKVLCYSPLRLRGKNIIQVSDEEFCVDPASKAASEAVMRTLTISMPSVVGVVALLLSISVTVHRLRVNIYTRFKFHPFDRDECLGEQMDYDVFLSCSSDDNLPHGNRIRELLEQRGYRACYPPRDFVAGDSIYDNIYNAVVRSKRTVCLLTEHFCQRFVRPSLAMMHFWFLFINYADIVDFSTLCSFKRTVKIVDLSPFFKMFLALVILFHIVFSERELMFMFAICRRPSVCLSSVVCRL